MSDTKEIEFIKEMILVLKNNTGNHNGYYEGYCDEWKEGEDCDGCYWHEKAIRTFGHKFGGLESEE